MSAHRYCDYPPAPPPPPGHTPAWKTIPPTRRWDAYRQIAESLPVIAETRGTLAAAIAVAEAGKEPELPAPAVGADPAKEEPMSSDYDAVCLSHDPAIILGMDESSYDAALHRARIDHPRCDLVVGRWSGGLIELCCPAMPTDRADWSRPHPGLHRDPIWADAGFLHIAAVVVHHAENDVALENALRKLPMCWTPDRLRLLSRVLGVPDGER